MISAAHPMPPAAPRRLGEGLLAALLGLGFTAVLFVAIARFEHTEPAAAVEFADVRSVVIDAPPPPPPQEVTREPLPIEATLRGIEAAPSESPVQIAVTPPDLEALLPPPPVAPPAVIHVGQLHTELKPRLEITIGANHVFQMAEVDKLPQVLNRVSPHIPPALLNGLRTPRVTLLFVVDAQGEIQNARVVGSSGSPEVDEVVRQSIYQWTFAPAVRRGAKVRCLLQQAMIIKVATRSRFEL